jgi:hypothetical protein
VDNPPFIFPYNETANGHYREYGYDLYGMDYFSLPNNSDAPIGSSFRIYWEDDLGRAKIWYNWDNNENETIYWDFYVPTSLGWHTLTVYAEDKAGNLTKVTWRFFIGTQE